MPTQHPSQRFVLRLLRALYGSLQSPLLTMHPPVIAVLRLQGREVQARRVHAVLQVGRPRERLPVDDPAVPELHGRVRFPGLMKGPGGARGSAISLRGSVY